MEKIHMSDELISVDPMRNDFGIQSLILHLEIIKNNLKKTFFI